MAFKSYLVGLSYIFHSIYKLSFNVRMRFISSVRHIYILWFSYQLNTCSLPAFFYKLQLHKAFIYIYICSAMYISSFVQLYWKQKEIMYFCEILLSIKSMKKLRYLMSVWMNEVWRFLLYSYIFNLSHITRHTSNHTLKNFCGRLTCLLHWQRKPLYVLFITKCRCALVITDWLIKQDRPRTMTQLSKRKKNNTVQYGPLLVSILPASKTYKH